MPYLPAEDRESIDNAIGVLTCDTPGELNYAISRLILNIMLYGSRQNNYALFSGIVGSLETCKHEFIRQVLDPYEDRKKEENGPVYGP